MIRSEDAHFGLVKLLTCWLPIVGVWQAVIGLVCGDGGIPVFDCGWLQIRFEHLVKPVKPGIAGDHLTLSLVKRFAHSLKGKMVMYM